jgi:hypothetical protein
MVSKVWTTGTVVDSPWLQDVDDMVYGLSNTAANYGAALVQSPTGTVEDRLVTIETRATATYKRRRVPSTFVRGDGNTRTDVFPYAVNYPGPGGVLVNKTPLEVARELGNVVAREGDDDLWVSPLGAGTMAGTSRANAMDWATAFRTTNTTRKLMLTDLDGPYPPLSLLSGTHAGAATPKWLYAVDGRVRFAADTALGQPPAQTWTAHSGAVYKSVLTSADYDRPQAILKTLVPNVRDGFPDSMLLYASVAELTALGTSGEGWYFDAATDTLYMTYYNADLTVSGNRNFHIVYSSKALDSNGELTAEWLLGGCTVILEGTFLFDGVWINSKEYNSTLPIFIAEGNIVQLCTASYGLRAEGLTFTKGRKVFRSKSDGFNGYKSNSSSTTGMTIEVDYVAMGCGDIGTFGTTARSVNNQGASAHGKHNLMIFGGLIEGCFGQGWADICDSTHNSATWGVGVITRDNYVSTVSYGIYMDSSAGGGTGSRAGWFDTCASVDNTRDLAAVESAVKKFNCIVPTQITTGIGTIVTYSPESP